MRTPIPEHVCSRQLRECFATAVASNTNLSIRICIGTERVIVGLAVFLFRLLNELLSS